MWSPPRVGGGVATRQKLAVGAVLRPQLSALVSFETNLTREVVVPSSDLSEVL